MRSLGLAILVCLAACKIDSTVYQPPADDDDDGDAATDDSMNDAMPDAPPQGISVVVNPGTTTVSEGGQVTVRVRLSEAPPVDRPIAITGTTSLTPSPSTVTFTPSNWNVERTIILAAGQDDDADDSPVTVLFDGMGDVADGSCMVMITDDDQQILLVSPPNTLGVTEGQTGQVQVQLTARPSANLVVAVASMDTAIATVSTGTLTFTPQNWNVAQTVTVTGTQDADTANVSTILILDPALDGVPTHTVAINVTDDDILAIDASPGNLGTIVEGGSGATFGVRLTQMPPMNVVVGLSASPSAAVNLSQSSLTFTPANYATVQMVTVSAPQDQNVVDEQVSIQLSAAGLADRFVQVSVDDNDMQVLDVTPATLGVTEGLSNTFSVSLRFEPGGSVFVGVNSADPTIAAADTSQLTFTPTDYSFPQIVTISGVEDIDLANESTQISFNAAAEGLTLNRIVNVTDDDMQVLDVSPTFIAVGEGGTNTFDVALSYQPATSVNVTVSVPSGSSGDISAAPTTLTFTPQSYNTYQTVTVTGLQDSDVTNENATVTVSSNNVPTRNVDVNVVDDDSIGITVTPASLTLTEGQAGMNIMVSLAAMPSNNVLVSLQTMPAGVASLSMASLTFTPQNFATPQAVTVTAVDDPDASDGFTTIYLTAPNLDEKTVPVTVRDDDLVTPVLTPNPVTIVEGTPDQQVQLTLSSDPGRSVTVTVPAFAYTDLEVNPTTYVFGPNDWNVPQIVTLTARGDDTADNESKDVVFANSTDGTQTTLRIDVTDPTILVGFPPLHGGSAAGITALEAWRDGPVPQCYLVEKLAIDVSTAPTSASAMSVGLYATGGTDTSPDALLWSSGTVTIGAGAGLRTIDVQDQQLFLTSNGITTWIAAEATTGITLKTKTTVGAHCTRAHIFGDFMPNPFNGGGSGTPDGGSNIVSVSCNQAAPVAIWLIGRDTSCGIVTGGADGGL